jgi:FAD/FMN-containing dehydrogenase
LSEGRTVLMERLDRMLEFDPVTGWLRCEAGVSIRDLVDTWVPKGFFPPVVPGTTFVTVGGALANDIHGKNHHVAGSWADHVRRVEVLTADGRSWCAMRPRTRAVLGDGRGFGLTGIILAMDVKLIPVHNDLIEMESIRVRDLDQFFEVSAQSGAYTHTVSWIDCTAKGAAMGRGIFMRGRHAGAEVTRSEGLLERAQRWASPMLDAGWLEPNWLLNQWTIKAFNEVYYRKQWRAVSESVVPLEPFFFPLDFVKNWNYLYGKRGFLQYQFVVPPDPVVARGARDLGGDLQVRDGVVLSGDQRVWRGVTWGVVVPNAGANDRAGLPELWAAAARPHGRPRQAGRRRRWPNLLREGRAPERRDVSRHVSRVGGMEGHPRSV